MLMQNWFRMAAVISLLASLLALMIDSVIRHVEANARAATEALGKLRVAYERLGLLNRRLEAAKEDERRFLAHELHDELGQTLTALKLRLQLGRARRRARAVDGVDEAVALVDDLIARVRKMSVDLRPPLLDEVGLVPALRAYLEAQSGAVGRRDGAGGGHREDAAAPGRAPARPIWRSLASASRRSRSPTRSATPPPGASASSSCSGAAAHHAVGQGRRPRLRRRRHARDRRGRGHLGVVGMRERVRAYGGTFQVISHPASGRP